MKSFFKGMGILIFAVVIGCCLGCFSVLWASTNASTVNPIVIAVVSGESKADYEAKLGPLLKDQLKTCPVCEVRNITPYNEEGHIVPAQIPYQLEVARSSSSFFFFNWNVKTADEHKPIIEALKKLAANGVMIVASAGSAKDSDPTLPLHRTLVGQIPGMIIIGELAERETLLTQGFFGPEMLTAVKPPKDYIGQGFGPTFFVSKLATNWNKRTAAQWDAHFKTTKTKVRRLWPSLNDFF